MIFNLDPHYKGGSHWISTFIDLKKKFVFFMDSTGDKIPKQIKTLIDRTINEARNLDIPLTLHVNKKSHQRQDTECGVYSLFVLIELLYDRKSPEYFLENRIPDIEMEKLRKKYFNSE